MIKPRVLQIIVIAIVGICLSACILPVSINALPPNDLEGLFLDISEFPDRSEGKYALRNAAEDWADSFASFVYPQYWDLVETIGRWYLNLHFSFECLTLMPNLDLYVNFKWWATGFDDPTDFAAIELGIQSYSQGNFLQQLPAYGSRLMRMGAPLDQYSNPAWPIPWDTLTENAK